MNNAIALFQSISSKYGEEDFTDLSRYQEFGWYFGTWWLFGHNLENQALLFYGRLRENPLSHPGLIYSGKDLNIAVETLNNLSNTSVKANYNPTDPKER